MSGTVTLGQKLRSLRMQREMPLTTCARLIGISKAHLCDIEYGRRNPSNVVLARLSLVLPFRIVTQSRVVRTEAAITETK